MSKSRRVEKWKSRKVEKTSRHQDVEPPSVRVDSVRGKVLIVLFVLIEIEKSRNVEESKSQRVEE